MKQIFKKRGRRLVVAGGLAAVVLAFVIFLAGALRYRRVFFDNTFVNDIEISGLDKERAIERLTAEYMQSYRFVINFQGEEHEVDAAAAGIYCKLDEDMTYLLAEQKPLFFLRENSIRHDYRFAFELQYDAEALEEYIKELDFANQSVAPTNAAYSYEDGKLVVTNSKAGYSVDADKVCELVALALSEGRVSADVSEACVELAPELSETDETFKSTVESLEAYLSMQAEYIINDHRESFTREELAGFCYIAEDGGLRISKQAVDEYLREFCDRYYDMYSDENVREFMTATNDTVQFYSGGRKRAINRDKEAVRLFNYLSKAQDFVWEPKRVNIDGSTNKRELGSKYVEIDLTNQHLYLIENGSIVLESDICSGCVETNMSTPSGMYGLTYKTKNANLMGPGYRTNVSYWMPFFGDYGMHDAIWKDEFGGDNYIWDGSHGCVNLPLDAAEKVYNFVEPGMTIVLYWR